MENEGDVVISLQNAVVFEIWLTQQKKENNKDALIDYFIQKCGSTEISDKFYKYLIQKARMLNIHLFAKWEKCHRRLDFFQRKYSGWLSSETVINMQINLEISSSETQCPEVLSPDKKTVSLTGRPKLQSSEKSERSKRRRLKKQGLRDVKVPIAMSDEEALAFLLENNFSKSQYCSIRTCSKQRNANIFPPYRNILAIKSKSRPDTVLVDDK